MMLRMALRQGRRGAVAATAFAAVNGIAQAFGYAALAGDTPATRAAFAAQMELLGRQLTFLLPVPSQVETLAGFLQWRHYGLLPLVYGAWGLLAAAGAARGDEERGLADQWLAAGVSRARYLAARLAAFGLLATGSTGLAAAAVFAAALVADGAALPAGGLAAQSVALVALSAACYGIGIASAQVAPTGRSAAGAAAAILGGWFLVAGAARSGVLEGVAPLSPFWQYERTHALQVGGSLDLASIAVLTAMTLITCGVAFVWYMRRDLGSSVLPRRVSKAAPRRGPAARRSLRLPVVALLDRQASALVSWAAAMAGLGVFLGSLLPTMIQIAKDIPSLRLLLTRGAADLDAAFVGALWGSILLFVLAAYAVAHVAGWVADETDGRLDLVLSAPVPRWRVVLERAAALAIGASFVVAVATGGAGALIVAQGLSVEPRALVGASALLVLLVVSLGAIGAALVGWRPHSAVPILAIVVAESYFIQQLAPMITLPDVVRSLSVFELYGSPLVLGPNWGGLGVQLVIIGGGYAAAILMLSRRDIAP